MASKLPSSDVFSWAYESCSALLCGHWAGPAPATELSACYQQLLAAAQAHYGCRFWLLDMQQRAWHDAAFAQWFGECFAPQASVTLGQPLFIACLVQPGERPQVEAQRTGLLLRQVAQYNVFPFYFTSEADARTWLRDQQAGECPPPVPVARQLVCC